MAHGEVATTAPAGQVSPWTAPTVGPVGGGGDRPLDPQSLALLDDVIDEAERMTGLRFSVYLGDLGDDPRSTASGLLRGLGVDSPFAVLLAVSPAQKVVEVVTGAEAARRISDRAARLAVLGVVSSASEGDLSGALVNGVRTLADQAGALPGR